VQECSSDLAEVASKGYEFAQESVGQLDFVELSQSLSSERDRLLSQWRLLVASRLQQWSSTPHASSCKRAEENDRSATVRIRKAVVLGESWFCAVAQTPEVDRNARYTGPLRNDRKAAQEDVQSLLDAVSKKRRLNEDVR
jgi:hypothetical protein